MQNYNLVLKRKEGSPILYISDSKSNITYSEKISVNIDGTVFEIPAIKGNNMRGHTRDHIVGKLINKNINDIKDYLMEFLYFYRNGSLPVKTNNSNRVCLQDMIDLKEKDVFYKYFGAMVTFMPNVKSDLSVHTLFPVILKEDDSKKEKMESICNNFGIKYVYSSELRRQRHEVTDLDITYPLTDF